MMQNRRGGFGPAEGVSRVYPSTNRASGQNKGHARRAGALGLRWFRNPAATRNGDSARQVAGKGRRRKERTRNIAGARSSADFPFRSAWSLQTGLGLSAAPVRARSLNRQPPQEGVLTPSAPGVPPWRMSRPSWCIAEAEQSLYSRRNRVRMSAVT